tara:strand:+ start:68 stop:541 length:474 start_codon:yes stop_codon:yes gene_type:complete
MHKTNQEIGSILIYRSVGSDSNRNTSFKLHKTIIYDWQPHAIKSHRNLNELKKHTFNRVHIPPFIVSLEGKTVHIEMEYIKGAHLASHEMQIIYEDCVLKEGDFTITNYTHTNFIREVDTDKIYYVDLEDVGEMELEERKKIFKNHYRNAPIVKYPY